MRGDERERSEPSLLSLYGPVTAGQQAQHARDGERTRLTRCWADDLPIECSLHRLWSGLYLGATRSNAHERRDLAHLA